MLKFHIGVEISTRSANENRSAIRSASAKLSRCVSLKACPFIRAYLASAMGPENSGIRSRQRSTTSRSQSGRAWRKPSRKTRAPALDSESGRGEQERCKIFATAHPNALMTASALVTIATFCMAKLIDALCQSAFMVEQQSSGTIMK
ncbi:hypothetical protein ABH991_003476 [Bradyrhizobium ottawaense]|uniref:Uncharacterized protein n=1 Tax=Bradyrhizobium ottawaense TaxID=931866 RepID=A0ABV4G6F8_9BRAD